MAGPAPVASARRLWPPGLGWTPAAVAGLAAADVVGSWQAGIAFTDWWTIVGGAALMLALALGYATLRPRPALSEALLYAGLWVGFAAGAACMTYLAASLARPLQDTWCVAADAALGFDWSGLSRLLDRHPWSNVILACVYRTLGVQIVVSILLLAFLRVRGRNEELLGGMIVSLVLTTMVFALWPTLGPVSYFHAEALRPDAAIYLPDLLALRSHVIATFAMPQLQGLIAFPSFHIVLAILLTYAQRSRRWTLAVFLSVNLAMLAAIPTAGGHYLVDMLAGAAIAGLTIAGMRMFAAPAPHG